MLQPQDRFRKPDSKGDGPLHYESMPVWQIVFLVLVWFGAYPGFKELFKEEYGITNHLCWWWIISISLFSIFLYRWIYLVLLSPVYLFAFYKNAFFSISKIKFYFRFDKRKNNWKPNKRLLNEVIRFVKESDRTVDIQFSRRFNFILVRTAIGENKFNRGKILSPFKYKNLSFISPYYFGFLLLYSLKKPIVYLCLLSIIIAFFLCKGSSCLRSL